MLYQLRRTQQLNCDLKTAWDFFSSPNNLAKITPKEMKFNVLTDLSEEPIYEGMIIDYTIVPLLGIPMKWRTKITQVHTRRSFMDFQEKGPYKLWVHFHEFIPNEQGVLMKDTVDYELPFGIIGDITHKLLVKKKVQHIFDYRYKVLEEMFNSNKMERL